QHEARTSSADVQCPAGSLERLTADPDAFRRFAAGSARAPRTVNGPGGDRNGRARAAPGQVAPRLPWSPASHHCSSLTGFFRSEKVPGSYRHASRQRMPSVTPSELKKQLIAAGLEIFRVQGNRVHLADRVRENLIMDGGVSA